MKGIGRLGPEHEKDSESFPATQSVIVFISGHTRNVGEMREWDPGHVATFLFRISFPHLPTFLAHQAESRRQSTRSFTYVNPTRVNCCFEVLQGFIGLTY
jgi:hypothetical protein